MKRQISLLLCICIFLITLSGGCSAKNASISKSGFYFDTIIKITLYGTNDMNLIDGCFDLAEQYENLFSNTIPESDISSINANAGNYVEVSDETVFLIQKGMEYGRLSNGNFDITLGGLTDLWDFSNLSKTLSTDDNEADLSVLPSSSEIENCLPHIGYENIRIDGNKIMLADPEAKLDLGGIAKGYIADRMKEYLTAEGVTAGIINLGGNILLLDKKADGSLYHIGIQKPFAEDNTAIAKLSLSGCSVVSSGVYERFYQIDGKIYHHILNPKTGCPIENNLYGVTIISKDSVDGDALSTTCFALGLEEGMALVESLPDVEAVFITDEYELVTSSGIGKEISFTKL